MKKIVIESAGGYEKLKIKEFPSPTPKEDEVLIEVKYSGINYADCLVRWGVYESAKKYVGWPITPGFEVSGKILAVGKNITNYKVGDLVIGFTLFNGYSSHICIPERHLLPQPQTFNLAQGAAFPAVYMTAYYSLFQIFYLPHKAKILVHSAAGGVGTALTQLAKAKGHVVAGVVGSNNKVQYCKNIGADFVYDKSSPDFKWSQIKTDFPEGFDVVFDANGPTTLKISYDLLRPTGKLAIYGAHSLLPKSGGKINYLKAVIGILKTPKFDPMKLVTDNKSIICFNVSFLFSEDRLIQENLNGLVEMINSGQIKPPHVNIFSFNDVAKAHQFIESGKSTGKLVLEH
ncbi:MAG: zinc-binding dehydrogenase [Oligoflexia bacterium]|nr:zinc-binding dehydrogenase [Oligoflexia bacterium]